MKSTCAGGLFLRIEAGVLERLEGDLYQQALLRIHELGLAGRNAERIRVELVDGGEKAALLGNHSARKAHDGVLELVRIPAIGRHATNARGSVS